MSVRRTTSHDMVRAEGLLEPMMLVAIGRDLRTDADGCTSELGSARLDARVTFPERVVERLGLFPEEPAIAELVGVSTRVGFRRRLEQLLPDRGASVAYQLLDDLPTAVLVSGVAVHAAGAMRVRPAGLKGPPADLCAGYVSGGTLQLQVADGGLPQDRPRTAAPSLAREGDPQAWHDHGALPPHSVRRLRRLDVWRESEAGAGADAFFRDTHTDERGVETVVHEYAVRARIDLATGTFTSCDADYGALPWPECPGALGSAGRLVGMRVGDLRARVREEFAGPSTCTHLNDVLRSLEPVPALLDLADPPRRTA